MKTALLAFFVFSLADTGAAQAVSPIASAYASTVIIYGNTGKQKAIPICSGFVVDSVGPWETVATARHCTDGIADREVLFQNGDKARVEGVSWSSISDVAILITKSAKHHPAVETSDTFSAGDSLFVIGMPSGIPWSYSSAISRNGTTEIKVDGEGPEFLFEAPSVWYGDSGAGVFDQQGRVVAIVDGGAPDELPNVIFAAPIKYALALFKE